MSVLKIPNRDARALWLSAHGLAAAPQGACDALGLIRSLGFVQLDTIQIVSRAHHHILWSRDMRYREPMLDRLLARDRQVFEHFTHDASVLPMAFLPLWQRQFRRMKEKVERSSWYGGALEPDLLALIKRRISDEGPLSTRDFDTEMEGPKEMWRRPPHKKALDYLWYAGELATSHREGFIKHYDLAERVFPADLWGADLPDAAQIDGLCHAALERIGFGTLSEIRRFWDATSPAEVAAWAERAADTLVPVAVEGADGSWSNAWACADIEERLAALGNPDRRLRILNPFDPAIRDRVRLSRLFGFDYTVEMFVPAAKRQWGYYVYPVLEGTRFVARIEARAERATGELRVLKLWHEPGVAPSRQRADRLDAELARLARLAGVGQVVWDCAR